MPGVKDGPRNLKQMGAGRGAGASSAGGSGQYPRMPRGEKRAIVRRVRKMEKKADSWRYSSSRPNRAGEKQTLSYPGKTANRAVKSDAKAGNTYARQLASRSVSPRMNKAPVKPSKSVVKRQAKFK